MVKTPVRHVRHWWSYVVRGIAGLALGVLACVSPRTSLASLLVLFGLFALINGAFTLSLALRDPQVPRWSCLIVEGIASSVAGAFTFLWPGMSPLVLLFVIASWSVLTGVSAVVAAIRLRRHVSGEWLLALSGGLSIAFGLLLFLSTAAGGLELVLWRLFPGSGTPMLVGWVGLYAVLFGVLLLALGLRLRVWGRAHGHLPVGADRHAPA